MIRTYVDDYVTQHRVMGYKFRIQNSLLTNFACFADQRNDQFIKTDTVLEWSRQAPSPAQKRNRLLTVRRLALSLHAEDPHHQIPPAKAFGHYCYQRRKPYIYSETDVKKLLHAASHLTPVDSIRAQTFITLISLLYVSGLRISEALALNTRDITEDGLIVQATKFNKDRLVPIHSSTRAALERYLSGRCRYAIAIDDAVFISNLGSRLAYSTAVSTFLVLLRSTGLRDGPGNSGPCLHDLRHTFAVRSLEQCSSANAQEIKRHTVSLCTYLGHAHLTDTYWYLEITPALSKQIAQTTEEHYLENLL